MFWLGLTLPVVYIPGYTGMSIPTSWALLSLVLPAWALWKPFRLTGCHWALLAFAALSVIYIPFSLDRYDAVWGSWQVILFFLAFIVGSRQQNLWSFFFGFGIGLTVNACVAYAQALGYHPAYDSNYGMWWSSGLFFNSMLFGEVLALGILGCLIYRIWIFLPFLVPALWLSHSHGGWLALVAGIVMIYIRSFLALTIIALMAAVYFTHHLRFDDAERLQTWYSAYTYLTLLGHGPGSFLTLWFFRENGQIAFPQYVHNDYIQLVFEYGALSAVPLLALLLPARNAEAPEWPIYLAFLLMASFSFPLYSPVASTIGAICAGRLSRAWALAWDNDGGWGLGFVPRLRYPQPVPARSWS